MSEREMGVETGPDGRMRCWWCLGPPEYMDYHDREWGRPLRGDVALFELLTLEAFQSGLSWLTILRRRDGFRRAFEGFEIERVAEFGERDVERLLEDEGIVRHRGKIEATIANARATRELRAAGGTLTELLWRFAPQAEGRPAPASGHDLAPVTEGSKAMAKELKRLGFRFVGPTTASHRGRGG
jgi:DNA-3-methyladenine glycosylase I